MNWIRKLIVLFIVSGVSFSASVSQAQTYAEFFKQKKTQKKYLLQQIVALKVYAGYLKKGYQVVDGGLSTIRDITNGEFKLHDAFINSLKRVSPIIKNDVRIAEIISLQISILKAFGNLKGYDFLSAENLAYVGLVADAVSRECFGDLEELLLIITSDRLEMKVDERLARLDKVYGSMLDKSAFTQDFFSNAALLIHQRQADQKDLNDIVRMFHFKE